MAIAWSGATQSNGAPSTFYQYDAEFSERSSTHVRVKVWLHVRMQYYSSFFSFAIAHQCKVNGIRQDRTLKYDRSWWGHQWEGYYYLWGDSSNYNYNGSNWQGPYLVFDGYVPVGLEDDRVSIVPLITRPPITGLGASGIYAPNNLDKTNWYGAAGVWGGFDADYQAGSWAWRPLTQDAAFINNRWHEELYGGLHIGKYPRPDDVNGVSLSITPKSIDVAYQDETRIKAAWAHAQRAAGYHVFAASQAGGVGRKHFNDTNIDSISFEPKKVLSIDEMFDGDEVYFGVQSFDGAGVTSRNITWSDPSVYFETPSIAPNEAYLIDRKGEPNRIIYKGESGFIHYSGDKDGSYAIETYKLVRIYDGAAIEWRASDASAAQAIGEKFAAIDIPGVKKPQKSVEWELQAYNTKGRPVYMSDGAWKRIFVEYYGGIVWVWDDVWHEGICWVFDGTKWHEAEAVYVYKNGDWKTL